MFNLLFEIFGISIVSDCKNGINSSINLLQNIIIETNLKKMGAQLNVEALCLWTFVYPLLKVFLVKNFLQQKQTVPFFIKFSFFSLSVRAKI